MLSEIRFKLLALVPFVSGATITFLSLDPANAPAYVILAGSVAGFLITVGILIYDYRNTQIIEVTRARCLELEDLLKLPIKGQFTSAQEDPPLLFKVIPLKAEWGLAIIYSTVLAAWWFLIVHALDILLESLGANTLLASLGRWATPWLALLISSGTFFVFLIEIARLVKASRTAAQQPVTTSQRKGE